MKVNLLRITQSPAPLRLGIFLSILLLLWLPKAALIYFIISSTPNGSSPEAQNWMTILTMGFLFVDFLFLLRFWGRKIYRQPHLLKRYGLDTSRQNGINLLKGLGFGLLQTFILFGLQGVLGWLVWQSPSMPLPRLVLEGSLTALGVGLAEELVFRGWLLDELERDYRPKVALWVSAVVFALLHFIKPLSEVIRTFPQFPGLLILGLMLVWAKRSHGGSLGISIGIHAGLVWGYYIISVGNLIQYSGAVPEWITGIDRNPLAGVMGLLLLSVAALGIKRFARSRSS